MACSCQQDHREPHERLRKDRRASSPLGSSRRRHLVVRMERTYVVQGQPGAPGVTFMHVAEVTEDCMLATSREAAALSMSTCTLAP